jgi:anti-sigma factor ChrR (cupin superfamily)
MSTSERVNADFSMPVVIDTNTLAWMASPQAGVDRRLLDRIGGEVARATSIVRYAAERSFPPHEHALGEEFLVLDGVFSDEHGDYPAGTYVRNPPGSRHAPRTSPGCTIFVKLRQMQPTERERVVVDTGAAAFQPAAEPGVERIALHADVHEQVAVERLAPGATVPLALSGGTEILVLDGALTGDGRELSAGSWLRLPSTSVSRLSATSRCVYWVKRGHLRDATQSTIPKSGCRFSEKIMLQKQ